MRTSNTAERLQQIMRERNLRQVDILALCAPWCVKYAVKMNRSDISQYVSGKVEPSQEKLIVLALALNVTETWLMGYDIDAQRDLPAGVIPISGLHPQKIPYLGEAAAGTPILTDQQYDAYISVDHPIKADACIRIHGDSMTPTYHDGDIVYIRQQDAVDDGAVAVVIIDNSAALKHVYRTPSGVLLTSDNPAYPPQRYTPEDISELNIHIYGIPVGFTRMFKGDDPHG